MKHVVLFSGGAPSAYIAYLLKKDPSICNSDIVLLHTPTLTELDDSEKFRNRVCRFLKLPMTVWGRGEDLYELCERNHGLPSTFRGFCTQQLKIQMKEEYFRYLREECHEDFIAYYGYDVTEHRRVEKAKQKAEIGQRVSCPIHDLGMESRECKRIIRDEWGIPLPSAYEIFEHNNCVPCFKSGKESFYLVYKHFPERYWKTAELEESVHYTVFKDKSLKELAKDFEKRLAMEKSQVTLEELYNACAECDGSCEGQY